MSIVRTYYLAHKTRGKLSREAAQPDHDLRLLVGHANLLDSLMVKLADFEHGHERWLDQIVYGAENEKAAAATDSSSSDSDESHDEYMAMYSSAFTPRPIPRSTPPALS